MSHINREYSGQVTVQRRLDAPMMGLGGWQAIGQDGAPTPDGATHWHDIKCLGLLGLLREAAVYVATTHTAHNPACAPWLPGCMTEEQCRQRIQTIRVHLSKVATGATIAIMFPRRGMTTYSAPDGSRFVTTVRIIKGFGAPRND